MSTDDQTIGGVTREQWKATEVAQASSIACGHCGERFATPHDFYAHLDSEHPKKKGAKNGRRR